MTPIDDGLNQDHPFPATLRKSGRPPRIQRNKIVIRSGIGAVVLVLSLGTCAGLLANEIASVKSRLEETVELVPELRSQLEIGNKNESEATYELMRGGAAAARETATGPLWKAASVVPWMGANFRAVTEVAVTADDIVSRAVGPLLEKYDSLNVNTLAPVQGQIDVAQLQEVAPSLITASGAVAHSSERLASINLDELIPQVANPIRSAAGQLQEVSGLLRTASSAAQLLPSMLGAEEPRTYLVLVQNNAETRATGGIPGALAILNTTDGRISLGDQSSASELGAFNPSVPVDAEQEAIYTARLGTQMQNVNLTPDFPTAAATAKLMWETRHPNETLDGVLALDPVALSYLLKATGPVDVTDADILRLIEGTSLPTSLTTDNVVATLLSDVYREVVDPKTQDAYFAAVAGRIFSAFTTGDSDSAAMLKALTTSAAERRTYVWSSRADEQDTIESTALSGSINDPGAGGTAFGVYFNDGTGAKMDYYVTRNVQLIQACPVDGYGRYTIRVIVTNNAPGDAASSLPNYVTGGGVFGVEPGRVRTNYVMYGPAQSFVESARVNGDTVAVGSGKHGQRPVGTVTQELAPGETAVIEVDFTRVVQESEPRLQVTPTVQPLTDVVLPAIREESCQ